MTTRDIVMASAGLGDSNYIAAYGATSGTTNHLAVQPLNVKNKDVNNIYVNALYGSTSCLIKTTSSGALVYAKYPSSFSSSDSAVAVDSNGNSYIGDGTFGYVFKLNSSGALTNQFYSSSSYAPVIDCDSSYIYYNTYESGTTNSAYAVKIDNNLTLASFVQPATGFQHHSTEIATDANYVYRCTFNVTNGVNVIRCNKSNLTGTPLYTYRLYSSSSSTYPTENANLCGFSSGFGVFCVGKDATYPTYGLAIAAKINSAGSIAWQRALVLPSAVASSAYGTKAIALPDGGMLCAFGLASGFQIVRLSSTGSVVWKRQISGTIVYSYAYCNLSLVGSNSFAISFSGVSVVGSTARDLIIANLPLDGTKTGSYTLNGFTFVYSASTLTDIASTMSAYAWSPANFTNASSPSTTSQSISDRALTSTSQVI